MKLRTVSLRRISLLTTVLVAATTAAASLVSDSLAAASAGAGGAFMLADFHLIRVLVSLLMRPGLGPRVPMWAVVLLTLKFLLAVVLVAGVFYQVALAPMWFALGASMLLAACVLDAAVLGEPIAADGAT